LCQIARKLTVDESVEWSKYDVILCKLECSCFCIKYE